MAVMKMLRGIGGSIATDVMMTAQGFAFRKFLAKAIERAGEFPVTWLINDGGNVASETSPLMILDEDIEVKAVKIKAGGAGSADCTVKLRIDGTDLHAAQALDATTVATPTLTATTGAKDKVLDYVSVAGATPATNVVVTAWLRRVKDKTTNANA